MILIITDRESGIAPDAVDKALEPYFRLEGSRGRGPGGSGLGPGIDRHRSPECGLAGLPARRGTDWARAYACEPRVSLSP